MAAAVAVMATTTTPAVTKRHGFSIESLIGTSDSTPSTASTVSTPPRPFPMRPVLTRELVREDRHTDRGRTERLEHSDKDVEDFREKEYSNREKELDVLRDREILFDSMRDRDFRDMRDRERSRDRVMRDARDTRDGCGSSPHLQRHSLRSTSPPSPRTDKSLTPETENRLSMWPGEEFKHLLDNIHNGQLDAAGLYQPLRVCNRTLASMGSMHGPGSSPNALGVAMSHHFSHLPINPLLYNLPRDLTHPPHPLLTPRYPSFMHPRYPIGPPPGLLFHPYRKPKRNRTAFSPSQLLQLEQAFEKNHYVVGQERKALAAKLQLTETQVKVWFQNRRTKHKRMKAEEDGGSSGSQVEGQDGDDGKAGDGGEFSGYSDHNEEDEQCSEEEEEEELSVTEDC
ncbi:unnamed protein product [Candidula unifasciata]|uniref:Homeobox domain-containing protein n=1 Tax=Candidula unifasciata TaxID=100452 RepID=A0A8S4A0S4_9EUPU|nr:unnamed protein product [Candidula unifasciata]